MTFLRWMSFWYLFSSVCESSVISNGVLNTETVTYDCSSYFRHEKVDGVLQMTIDEIVKEECGENFAMKVEALNFIDCQCVVLYEFWPSKELMLQTCRPAVSRILANATMLAWGHQWGCDDQPLDVQLTPYYSVLVQTVKMINLGVEKRWRTRCYAPIIQLDKPVEIVCAITPHGGYRWKMAHPEECVESTLINVTHETFRIIQRGWLIEKELQLVTIDIHNILSYDFCLIILVKIARILDLFSHYLEDYHGALIRFEVQTSNLVSIQLTRDNKLFDFTFDSAIGISVERNQPPCLFTCTQIFRDVSIIYDGNRIVGGMCLARIRSHEATAFRIRFINAQWSQLDNYRCVRFSIDRSSLYPRLSFEECSMKAGKHGDIICTCTFSGYIILLQMGTGKDDMRHMVFNPMEKATYFNLLYVLVCVLFVGSVYMALIQFMHTLFLCGMKILFLVLTTHYDDDDSCVFFGFVQIGFISTFEAMNLFSGIFLLLIRRSHRPMNLLIRMVVIVYTFGALKGAVYYIVDYHNLFNINCFPTKMRSTMVIPYTLSNIITILLAAYTFLYEVEHRGEVVAVLLGGLSGLIQWAALTPMHQPGKQFQLWIGVTYILQALQGVTLFMYHCVLKPRGLRLLVTISKTLIYWMRRPQRGDNQDGKVTECQHSFMSDEVCENLGLH
ncbi:hypothetical protein PHET_04185 [Paragonimus heterotremus]|uniref:Intimal thickness related receptor IRP domain-containing protein n=1 Tax=Paragonimus heterotremus TaxID=100268 RepID=A0A8J4SSJ0_9TREM|nr:hypothetical protein PHET_04185 [Paragonimus heterotremus]